MGKIQKLFSYMILPSEAQPCDLVLHEVRLKTMEMAYLAEFCLYQKKTFKLKNNATSFSDIFQSEHNWVSYGVFVKTGDDACTMLGCRTPFSFCLCISWKLYAAVHKYFLQPRPSPPCRHSCHSFLFLNKWTFLWVLWGWQQVYLAPAKMSTGKFITTCIRVRWDCWKKYRIPSQLYLEVKFNFRNISPNKFFDPRPFWSVKMDF